MVQSILVGTDGSATASIAVTQAIDLARAVGARLQIVSAYEPVTAGPLGIGRLHAAGEVQWPVPPRENALPVLDAAREEALAAGVADVETFPRVGDAADAILDVAEEVFGLRRARSAQVAEDRRSELAVDAREAIVRLDCIGAQRLRAAPPVHVLIVRPLAEKRTDFGVFPFRGLER